MNILGRVRFVGELGSVWDGSEWSEVSRGVSAVGVGLRFRRRFDVDIFFCGLLLNL